jgi:hypothetical protein
MADKAFLERMSREAADAGKLVEAGWLAMRIAIMPANCSPTQLTEMRKAYYFGAQHVFASIMTVLSPGEEITEEDLARMSKLNDELNAFLETQTPPPGRAQ